MNNRSNSRIDVQRSSRIGLCWDRRAAMMIKSRLDQFMPCTDFESYFSLFVRSIADVSAVVYVIGE